MNRLRTLFFALTWASVIPVGQAIALCLWLGEFIHDSAAVIALNIQAMARMVTGHHAAP